MLKLNVKNETSRLRAVVLGTAVSNGPTPKIEEAYDPKSLQHIKAGTYPIEEDMVKEMEAVAKVFKKYDVKVYRPELIKDCNQIFARDIAFVIDDVFVKANILPDRENELEAIQYIIDQVDPKKVIRPPEEAHIEGGDVMLWNDYIFIGTYRGEDYSDYIVARTNKAGVDFIKEQFPHKKVKSFDLNKSQTNPYDNALHLDCCFQPIGTNKAILHKEGFRDQTEFEWLLNYFGEANCFIISKEEMYNMNSNIFSISEDVIISEKNFSRLNTWLRENGFTVEEVPYAEIAKQEGLLRCSTMPLIRD
ncbi:MULTISPECIES: dimethylarginine dimethylaminohydrolase family protein [Mesoflavibacter]|uniref:arginine deiminase n=1 Tax=Mesoflavibacter profundi TaxID=2708110 RepID=A0ABT4S3I3_9FLAO|nr:MULTISPECIES: arginine deiminase-related protein [Mesoflavibacter]MDA0178576.1 arginine deiminase-related protein [Mesoflavibacter profundi]QIJ89515.1 NG,NG-dimethylarginine dimethylaminohydrolase 1 [Mesoflavibacter sp. HG96]QIJ92243.1 NG,NG-dimethylarginine dimethylaminohydrolase 1 [Mesoflavibacter sp. HG37]